LISIRATIEPSYFEHEEINYHLFEGLVPSVLILIKIREVEQRHGSIQPHIMEHMAILYRKKGTDILNIQYRFNKPSFVFFVNFLKGIWKFISFQKACFTCKLKVTSKLPLMDFACINLQRRNSTYQSIKLPFQPVDCLGFSGDCSGNQQLPPNQGSSNSLSVKNII